MSTYSSRICILTQFEEGPGLRQYVLDVCQLGYELRAIVGAGIENAGRCLIADLTEEEGEDNEDGGLGKWMGNENHSGLDQRGSWFLFLLTIRLH